MSLHRSVFPLLALPLALSLFSCTTDSNLINLKGSDTGVSSQAGELRYTMKEWKGSINDTKKLYLEAGASRNSGKFTQRLGSGEAISINGTVLSGPAVLYSGIAVQDHYFRLIFDITHHNNLGIAMGAGIKSTNINLNVSTTSQRASVNRTESTINVIASLHWRLLDALRVEGIIDYSLFGAGVYDDNDSITDNRLHLCYLGIEHLHLCGGYRFWSARKGGVIDETTVDVDLSGPLGFVRLDF